LGRAAGSGSGGPEGWTLVGYWTDKMMTYDVEVVSNTVIDPVAARAGAVVAGPGFEGGRGRPDAEP